MLLDGLLRHLGGCCGTSWGPLRVLLGPLRPSWEPLRVSWKPLGVSRGTLGCSWRPSWGGIEGSSGDLGRYWIDLGPSWPGLVPSLGDLGSILGELEGFDFPNVFRCIVEKHNVE